ncbi:MAG: ATP-binding protein [Planctomycetota bacterium]|nr:ATP-binding protein [Planctomycetota bacterium]
MEQGSTSGLASYAELRTAIEAIDDGLVVHEADGRISQWNAAALRILGLTSDQLQGKTPLDPTWRTVHPDGTPFPGEEHPASVTLRTGKPQTNVVMGVDREGRGTVWLSITSRLLPSTPVHAWATVVTFRDITREREALAELRSREALLHATLDSLPAGLFVATPGERRLLRHNRPLAAILALGARERELDSGALDAREIAAHLRGLVQEPAAFDEFLARASAAGAGEPAEAEFSLRDGRVLRHQVRGLRDELGVAVGELHVIEDVTTRVRSEEERRTLDRRMQDIERLESLGVLAGGIAHDFNNLLTSIVGSAELAALAALPGSALARQMERVLEASSRATALCQQMLSYSGTSPAVVLRLHLSDTVREAVHWLERDLREGVRLDLDLAPELPAMLADPAQVHQLTLNLILNACESLPAEGGLVRVATAVVHCQPEHFARAAFSPSLPAGDYLELVISDCGCGIAPATLERIFDPFFSTKFSGSGLGLSAALGIARRHRGALFVESEPGRGTTVRVLFPSAPTLGGPA